MKTADGLTTDEAVLVHPPTKTGKEPWGFVSWIPMKCGSGYNCRMCYSCRQLFGGKKQLKIIHVITSPTSANASSDIEERVFFRGKTIVLIYGELIASYTRLRRYSVSSLAWGIKCFVSAFSLKHLLKVFNLLVCIIDLEKVLFCSKMSSVFSLQDLCENLVYYHIPMSWYSPKISNVFQHYS